MLSILAYLRNEDSNQQPGAQPSKPPPENEYFSFPRPRLTSSSLDSLTSAIVGRRASWLTNPDALRSRSSLDSQERRMSPTHNKGVHPGSFSRFSSELTKAFGPMVARLRHSSDSDDKNTNNSTHIATATEQQNNAPDTSAAAQFLRSFPLGASVIAPTGLYARDGLHNALEAIVQSMRSQLSVSLPLMPIVPQLLAIHEQYMQRLASRNHPEHILFSQEDRSFTPGLLVAVVYYWVQSLDIFDENALDIKLGIVTPERADQNVFQGMLVDAHRPKNSGGQHPFVVWIYHDQTEADGYDSETETVNFTKFSRFRALQGCRRGLFGRVVAAVVQGSSLSGRQLASVDEEEGEGQIQREPGTRSRRLSFTLSMLDCIDEE
ncbi:hypothetical protein B0T17DRAFT_505147 [Bombardia bombarda]|uniref:Uncharacterized protein n=1 Tax=Bombardia bombarda TaxID=252184 RepID=A0AA40C8U0_9PEZI|nr:hypothetical protein B0T17DRAFT_505147 [Bombardia bombarda]